MDPVSDMAMAVNTTYSSILNEIQLSNLNYSIQMTPYASYITLKKSVQTDLTGAPATPSPPLLFLLQTSQQENHQLREENCRLKSALEMKQSELVKIKKENEYLGNSIEESNISVKTLNFTITDLHSQLNVAKTELENCCADKADMNDKAKEAEKKHLDKAFELKAQIQALSKNSRVQDKKIHDLSKNVENARHTIKNLKSEKSQLKMSKTKLTGEKRELEKKLVDKKSVKNMKTNRQQTKLKSVVVETKICDENENVPSSTGSSPLYSSMIAHWNPPPLESSSFTTMVAHSAQSLPPSGSLCSTQEFQEMLDKMCERVFAKLGWGKFE